MASYSMLVASGEIAVSDAVSTQQMPVFELGLPRNSMRIFFSAEKGGGLL